ncbi:MAG: hypothetical protein KDI79_26365, partial [Anaerolineae bacterium]|nr:hypothetical protein [Anaerolineae bacterium]
LGTPAYLAPEQARQDRTLDGRTDLYSLGVMLYQMVTGRLPFQGTTFQMIHAHVYETPPAPSTLVDVCPGLERIIMTALAKDPADRFPDGRAMARELLALNEQYQERTPPTLDDPLPEAAYPVLNESLQKKWCLEQIESPLLERWRTTSAFTFA